MIAVVGKRLDELDKAHAVTCPDRLYSRRDDEAEGESCERAKLLTQLNNEMREYDELLLREHAIASITRPTRKKHRGYFDWVYNNKPLVREEYEFLYHQDDFVVLGSQEDSWLGSFVETMFAVTPSWLLKVRCPCSKLLSFLLTCVGLVYTVFERKPQENY